MLTWAVTFLLIAIFAGIFGMMAAGPVGLILFVVFFAAFIWSMAQYLRGKRPPSG